jgi:hypothetical protein
MDLSSWHRKMFIGHATDKRQSVARGDLEMARCDHVVAGFAGFFSRPLTLAGLRASGSISG